MAEIVLPAPLWRRLIAGVYDALLVAGLLMMAVMVMVISASLTGTELHRRAVQLVCFGVAGAYFCWSWTRGGQTLGMRTWRLMLRRDDGAPVRLPIAVLRYAAAWLSLLPAGLGFLHALIDGRRRTWHDMLAGTEMVVLPKPPKP